MQYIKNVKEYREEKPSVITLGKFDGFHRGHQKLLAQVVKLKEEMQTQEMQKQDEMHGDVVSIVCAFDMSAFYERLGLDTTCLMIQEERVEFLSDKVDYLLEPPFTSELLKMSPRAFVEELLVNQLHVRAIVVGEDFCFGFKKEGNVDTLLSFGREFGYKVFVVEKECIAEGKISSTMIKSKLASGNLSSVNELLGHTYSITGMVEHGKRLGRTIGFPTMNIYPKKEKLLPPFGVYACKVHIEGEVKEGILNLGVKPTVTRENEVLAEVHVIDFEREIYGEVIKVDFLKFIRKEEKFASVEALRKQIAVDVKEARVGSYADDRIDDPIAEYNRSQGNYFGDK